MGLQDLDKFTDAYVVCALWSSCDDDDHPLEDNYGPEDLSPEAVARVREDCEDFVKANAHLLVSLNPAQAGHDFWLTRNGHGAGFWDRGLGELGDKLTKAAEVYGSQDLYVGDDGKLYV